MQKDNENLEMEKNLENGKDVGTDKTDNSSPTAPVITMKGLSGKTISGVVKVVRVKKKAKAVAETDAAAVAAADQGELAGDKSVGDSKLEQTTATKLENVTNTGALKSAKSTDEAVDAASSATASVAATTPTLAEQQTDIAAELKETVAASASKNKGDAQLETGLQTEATTQAETAERSGNADIASAETAASAELAGTVAQTQETANAAANAEITPQAATVSTSNAAEDGAKKAKDENAESPKRKQPNLEGFNAPISLPTKLGKIDDINRDTINRAKRERENQKRAQASKRAVEATKALESMHRQKTEQPKESLETNLKPTLSTQEIVVPKPIGKIQLPLKTPAAQRDKNKNNDRRFGAGNNNAAFKGNRPNRNDGNFAGDKDKDDDRKPISHARKPKTTQVNDGFAELMGKDTQRRNFGQKDSHKKRNDVDEHRKAPKNGGRDKGRSRITDFEDDDNERRRGRRKNQINHNADKAAAQVTHVSLPAQLTVKEFAEAIKKSASEVIMKLMAYGVMVNMNQDIDYDTAATIADEFGITCDPLVEVTEEDILFDDSEDIEENLQARPPVVVVMGHVDHGKTTLLDHIRNANVASGEAGGITQHIGAYTVSLNGRKITFLDTPGHEAFTTMRARGAQATDIAILVVAADDGVMPQTVEAINHAKAAKTEIIVAINKMDKPGANPDRVKQELANHDLLPEEWGGSTIMVPISAKQGDNVDQLLEMVLLTADLMELKADPERQAKGVVLEASLDKNRGVVASLLVQRGTLKRGDTLVTGSIVGNIRAMIDSRGQAIKQAGPSVPVQIIGLPEIPEAGEIFYQVNDERMAKQLAEKRRNSAREEQIKKNPKISLDALFNRLEEGKLQDLNIIVKGDVVGSVEAMNQSLLKLSNNEVRINIIHSAAGAITETDVRLAEVSNAIIIGFNVRPNNNVVELAEELGVDIRLYRVIYNALEDIEKAMKGLLAPTYKEKVIGHVEVRETFKVSSIGTIAGGYVTDGKAQRNAEVRLLRDSKIIYEGKLAGLKRFKDDVKEVNAGYECGISLENYNDIKVGDVFELYEMAEVEVE